MSDEWRDWRFAGIYGIRHIESRKIYVGQSKNMARRIGDHRYEQGNNKRLRNSIKCHGWNAFEKILLEAVDDPETLTIREQYWIDFYDSANPTKGYNIRPVAESNRSLRHSDETKLLLSAKANMPDVKERRRLARTGVPLSPEHYASILVAARRPERRKKLSASKTGVPLSPEHCDAIRVAQNRPEVKEKKRLAMKDVPKSPEHCRAISMALTGKPKTPEHCANFSIARKGVPLSERGRIANITSHNRPEVRYSASLKTTLQYMRQRAVDHAAAEAAGQLRLFADDAEGGAMK